MNFAVNYLAVIVAAIVGIGFSALWYTLIMAGPTRAARAEDAQIGGVDPPVTLLPIAMLGNLVGAFVLAVILKSSGGVTIVNGLVAGGLVGIGIALPVVAQIHLYGFRPPMFVAIDGAEWLIALLLMGAVIGALG
jgi:hypothetical protein